MHDNVTTLHVASFYFGIIKLVTTAIGNVHIQIEQETTYYNYVGTTTLTVYAAFERLLGAYTVEYGLYDTNIG